MKKSLFLAGFFILACALEVHAQLIKSSNSPVWFIDSVSYEKAPIIDQNNIQRLDVTNPVAGKPGEIHLQLKPGVKLSLMTLGQIAAAQHLNSRSLVFMIDDQFVQDTANVKIDSTFLYKYVVLKTSQFKYAASAKFLILNILTNANKKPDGVSTLRGFNANL
jgi:hypothetical protein